MMMLQCLCTSGPLGGDGGGGERKWNGMEHHGRLLAQEHQTTQHRAEVAGGIERAIERHMHAACFSITIKNQYLAVLTRDTFASAARSSLTGRRRREARRRDGVVSAVIRHSPRYQ